MKSISLSLALNSLISFVIIFTLTLLILSFLKVQLWVLFLFTLFISLPITIFIFLRLKNKEQKRNLMVKSKQQNDGLILTLNTLKKDQITQIFCNLFTSLKVNFTEKSGYFLVNNTALYPAFFIEPLSVNEAKFILNNSPFSDQKHIIISNAFKENVRLFCEQFNLLTMPTSCVLDLLLKHQLISPTTLKKAKKQRLITALFKRVNGKRFILYGVMLLLLSLIVFYPIYYIVSGMIFVVFGLISLLFGKKEQFLNNFCDLLTALNIDEKK